MPYVSRDGSGAISGLYANRQDNAEEFISASDAAIVTFLNPVRPRMATGKQLCEALADLGQLSAWDAAVQATTKPEDRLYWYSSYHEMIPENNSKIARIAARATPAIAVSALFDKALTEPAV